MSPTTSLFRFPAARPTDPGVADWFLSRTDHLGLIALECRDLIRQSGPDIRSLLHDGRPTICVEDAAFAYVAPYKSHVGVGFFQGASLDDPRRLLEGTGKRMRHVKIRRPDDVDTDALRALVKAAYNDMRARLDALDGTVSR